MKHRLLDILCCPRCHGDLALSETIESEGEIESGKLVCSCCSDEFPIIGFLPRFVPPENYAKSFGLQWTQFGKTQLDSHSGVPISRDRFLAYTAWSPGALSQKTVLDVGCGSGRFSEVALSYGANLVALDYSSAVDACWDNFKFHPALSVVQGDIYSLPFKPGSFDFVYCLGVLQHTPDVKKAFEALPPQLCADGRLVVDLYPKLLWNALWPKYWLRPLTKRISPEHLLWLVKKMVRVLLPLSILIGRIPLIGRKLRHGIPVVNYEGIYPLSRSQLREWAILDTLDMLAPTYDHPQSIRTVRNWFLQATLRDVEVFRKGFIVGRGRKG